MHETNTPLAEPGLSLEAAIQNIVPLTFEQRLQELRSILDDRDVPYPIPEQVSAEYYRQAASGTPFGIGSLSGLTVNLDEYRNEQFYENMTLEDHASWARLVKTQQATKHRYACREYLSGEQLFHIGGNLIPDYYALNARIFQQTGWQLATVSEIIPAHVFFHCHSNKFFPVTTFMRPYGTDYLEEPDIGHDVAGHVATFTIPQVAQVMNNHGLANDQIHAEKEAKLARADSEEEAQAIRAEATELLLYAGRLYWFTVEFGLVLEAGELKAFGAGILSSPGETRYSVDSPLSNRVLVDPSDDRDLLRLATTDYLISEYQKTYFVMKDFDTLSSLSPERILAAAKAALRLPHHTWRELAPGDDVLNVGACVAGASEKYLRLLAGEPLDECCRRAAIRNLKLFSQRPWDRAADIAFVDALPPLNEDWVANFVERDSRGEFPPELTPTAAEEEPRRFT